MKHILFAFAAVFLFTACQPGTVYKEFEEIPNYTWERDHDIGFHADISDISTLYDIELHVRHMTGFNQDELRVVFRIVSPSGSVRSGEQQIPIRDENGKYYADGMGDLWDLSYTVHEGIRFSESGEYYFEINNVMPRPRIPGIMELGLQIRKSELSDLDE